jgi:hypothetical protein
MKLVLALLTLALAASAAGIDGRWSAEATPRKNAKNLAANLTFTLDLKTQDGKLVGTVSLPGKKKPRIQNVEGGAIDGNKVTFTTTQTAKKRAAVKFTWQATIDGDQLTGTRTREGAKKGVPFTAKRG